MSVLFGPIARILLRYLSGALVAVGLLLPGDALAIATDPEMVSATVAIIGAVVGAATELAYMAARRLGWST